MSVAWRFDEADDLPQEVGPKYRVVQMEDRLDVDGVAQPSAEVFEEAQTIYHEWGIGRVFARHLDQPKGAVGKPKALSFHGLAIGGLINGMGRKHVGELIGWVRTLNGMSSEQRRGCGIREELWVPRQTYNAVTEMFGQWAQLCDGGESKIERRNRRRDPDRKGKNSQWVIDNALRGSLYDYIITNFTRAVDMTDIESFAILHGHVDTVTVLPIPGMLPDYDEEEAEEGEFVDEDDPSKEKEIAKAKADAPKKPRARRAPKKVAKVFGYRDNGVAIYSEVDRDANAGHRSATGSRRGGFFFGRNLATATLTRDVTSRDCSTMVKVGDPVPNVITTATLVPANSHPAKSIVPNLIEAKATWDTNVRRIVWDRGFSQSLAEFGVLPLYEAGIETLFILKGTQLGARGSSKPEFVVMIDGSPFHTCIPDELKLIPMPPFGASLEERKEYQRLCDLRAQYRWTRLSKYDKHGWARFRCPVCAGLLRRDDSTNGAQDDNRPIAKLPDGAECCKGIIQLSFAETEDYQVFSHGTTAHATAYSFRQAVEGTYAGMKGQFININRGFFKLNDSTKLDLMLAFTLVGYNRWRLKAFRRWEKARGILDAKLSLQQRKTGRVQKIDGWTRSPAPILNTQVEMAKRRRKARTAQRSQAAAEALLPDDESDRLIE